MGIERNQITQATSTNSASLKYYGPFVTVEVLNNLTNLEKTESCSQVCDNVIKSCHKSVYTNRNNTRDLTVER